MARNNRTRTTESDDSNDFSRRCFIQGSVAAAAGILGLNPSSQAEAAQKSPENNGKDDFKGKRPNPGSSGTSFISLFNNLGSSYSSTPGPISFENENGGQGILQSSNDIILLSDNSTINILTSGFYLIQYNATIELNDPSTGEWFTAVNLNGTDIVGPACKAPTTINQTTNLPFNGSLISVNVFTASTIQLRVVVVDGINSWKIGPNVNGYGTASMTIVNI